MTESDQRRPGEAGGSRLEAIQRLVPPLTNQGPFSVAVVDVLGSDRKVDTARKARHALAEILAADLGNPPVVVSDSLIVMVLEGDPHSHTDAIAREAYRALDNAVSILGRDAEAVRVGLAHTAVSRIRSSGVLAVHAVLELALVSPSYEHRFSEWARDHKKFIDVMTAPTADAGQLGRDFRNLALELKRSMA